MREGEGILMHLSFSSRNRKKAEKKPIAASAEEGEKRKEGRCGRFFVEKSKTMRGHRCPPSIGDFQRFFGWGKGPARRKETMKVSGVVYFDGGRRGGELFDGPGLGKEGKLEKKEGETASISPF